MAAAAATAVPFGATWLWPEAGAEGGTDAARSTDPGGAGGVGPPTESATGREWPLHYALDDCAITVALISLLLSNAAAQTPGTFTATGSMTGPRYLHTATLPPMARS